MLITVFIVFAFLCTWPILKPLLVREVDNLELSEIEFSEQEDISKFLETLKFEKERGLISEAEYNKQELRAKQRLQSFSSDKKLA